MSADPLQHATPQILIGGEGALRVIELNRPEALNALTLEMIRAMAAYLDHFETAPAAGYVALRGAGSRGLCAGGDIRTLYNSILSGDGWAEAFWAEEYALNARIGEYPKPYISLMDGIVMGGGVGVSAHAKYRIVTERTKIAMPEVGIGLIPDVGGTWLLSRAPGETGTCLALTGMTVGGADAVYAGLADYFVEAAKLDDLLKAVAALPAPADPAALTALLKSHHQPHATSLLLVNRKTIDACFAKDRVEDIILALERTQTPFARDVLAQMRAKSPVNLKVTLELLRRARTANNLRACLESEFTAIMQAIRHPDAVEGIRAAVIDKDRNPKWRPAHLAEVDQTDLEPYFAAKPRMTIPFHEPETLS
jgi:enoyl-CoA hydratase